MQSCKGTASGGTRCKGQSAALLRSPEDSPHCFGPCLPSKASHSVPGCSPALPTPLSTCPSPGAHVIRVPHLPQHSTLSSAWLPSINAHSHHADGPGRAGAPWRPRAAAQRAADPRRPHATHAPSCGAILPATGFEPAGDAAEHGGHCSLGQLPGSARGRSKAAAAAAAAASLPRAFPDFPSPTCCDELLPFFTLLSGAEAASLATARGVGVPAPGNPAGAPPGPLLPAGACARQRR